MCFIIISMLVFYPEVHLPQWEAQKRTLIDRATQGEFVLLLECKQYDPSTQANINGFETLDPLYPETVLCSTYTMSLVPFITLKEGGNHSIAVLVFFLYISLFYPSAKEYMTSFSDEEWYASYDHFLQDISFDIRDFENCNECMKQHVRKRAALFGGLPSKIPYEVIRNSCLHTLQQMYPSREIDDIVIEKTLIEREMLMADNIIDALKNYPNQSICICIGAGHLMPFLSERQIANLGLDPFFTGYHQNIQETRLLHRLRNMGISYKVEI